MRRRHVQLAQTAPTPETMSAVLAPPAATATRGGASQHLVFLTADHLLDLQVDYAEDLTIVGQIVNKAYCAVSQATVEAVSEHGVLVTATTGSGGEFLVACRPRGAMRVRIAIDDKVWIELPLPRRRDVH